MKKILLIAIFCFTASIYAQNKDEIYRVESKIENPGIATYDVNILTLYENGSYELMHQKYRTKKFMKKNVVLRIDREYGKWQKKEEVLFLKDKESQRVTKFFIKSTNKIALLIEGSEVSTVSWKKLN